MKADLNGKIQWQEAKILAIELDVNETASINWMKNTSVEDSEFLSLQMH